MTRTAERRELLNAQTRAVVAFARAQNHRAVAMTQHGKTESAELARYRRDLWMDDARRYQRLLLRNP